MELSFVTFSQFNIFPSSVVCTADWNSRIYKQVWNSKLTVPVTEKQESYYQESQLKLNDKRDREERRQIFTVRGSKETNRKIEAFLFKARVKFIEQHVNNERDKQKSSLLQLMIQKQQTLHQTQSKSVSNGSRKNVPLMKTNHMNEELHSQLFLHLNAAFYCLCTNWS